MNVQLIDKFTYSHLPEHLQEISKIFCDAAREVNANLPEGRCKQKTLELLMDAKNWAVLSKVG